MPSGTIGIVWGDSQLGSLTHAHLGNPFFPASDHLLLAQHKLKGLVSVPGGIEFLSIFKHPRVVHHAGLATLREGAPVSRRDGLHLHSRGCGSGGRWVGRLAVRQAVWTETGSRGDSSALWPITLNVFCFATARPALHIIVFIFFSWLNNILWFGLDICF